MIWRVAFLILLPLASRADVTAVPPEDAAKELVRLAQLDYSIKSQLNAGAPKECVLLREVAGALVRAQEAARLAGYTLKVLECYRPFSSSPKLPVAERQTLARANTVEVIFVEPSGAPAMLPKPHDQAIMLSAKPYSAKEAKKNRKKLVDLLVREGFVVSPAKWWRFTFPRPEPAIFDVALSEVPKVQR